jgi:hypothetical protein
MSLLIVMDDWDVYARLGRLKCKPERYNQGWIYIVLLTDIDGTRKWANCEVWAPVANMKLKWIPVIVMAVKLRFHFKENSYPNVQVLASLEYM